VRLTPEEAELEADLDSEMDWDLEAEVDDADEAEAEEDAVLGVSEGFCVYDSFPCPSQSLVRAIRKVASPHLACRTS
jgi:hypothetical protein